MPTLHWLNDEEARRAARDVPYRLLEEDKERFLPCLDRRLE